LSQPFLKFDFCHGNGFLDRTFPNFFRNGAHQDSRYVKESCLSQKKRFDHNYLVFQLFDLNSALYYCKRLEIGKQQHCASIFTHTSSGYLFRACTKGIGMQDMVFYGEFSFMFLFSRHGLPFWDNKLTVRELLLKVYKILQVMQRTLYVNRNSVRK